MTDGRLLRLFWVAVVLLSGICLYLTLNDWAENESRAEVTFTPDTLYLDWSTAFPGVTVCENCVTSYAEVQHRFNAMYPSVMNPLDYKKQRYLTEIICGGGPKLSCRGKEGCPQCSNDYIACDIPWKDIAARVRKSCDELITNCTYSGKEFPCISLFHKVDSDDGDCFAFNTVQHRYSTIEGGLLVVNRSTGPGLLTFNVLSEIRVSVHSSEELSTLALDSNYILEAGRLTKHHVFLFSVVETVNSLSVRDVDIEERGCRFPDEIPDEPFHNYEVYSYGACRLARQTALDYAKCGCVHPVRDLRYKDKYCNYTGVLCWARVNKKLSVGADNNDDRCLPSCVESEIKVIRSKEIGRKEDVVSDNGLAMVSIKMASLPALRYHRNILNTDLDIAVLIGGLVGLFFGASILSLAETMYLILRKP